MDNRKKIIFGLIAGIIFIIAFILNLLFPPKPFIKTAHAVENSLDGSIQYFLDNPDVNLQELIGDETHYNYFKDYAASRFDVELPAWDSSNNDDVYNFFRNLASGFVGQYAVPSSAKYVELMGDIDDLTGILEYIHFDSVNGEFVVSPANGSGLVDRINHTIYESSPGETIGNFVPLPIEAPNGDHLYNMVTSGIDPSAPIWAAMGGNTLVLCSLNSSNAKAWTVGGNIKNYNVSGNYVGTARNGFYRLQSSDNYISAIMSYLSSAGFSYVDTTSALQDFFGGEFDSGDPVLTGALIVNDDPTFNGMSLPSSVTYDYSTTIINNYNDEVVEPIPNRILNYQPYTYTYTIPYDNTEYELPTYPEIPHDLPQVSLSYPEISANEDIQEGMNGLNSLWVTLLTMGGSFIVLKVIL